MNNIAESEKTTKMAIKVPALLSDLIVVTGYVISPLRSMSNVKSKLYSCWESASLLSLFIETRNSTDSINSLPGFMRLISPALLISI